MIGGSGAVAVIGAGHVGASVAHALVLLGVTDRVVLYDRQLARAEGEAWDIADGTPLLGSAEVMLGTGRQHRSTVHVADLANAFRRALEDGSAHGTYVIGDGVNPTVAELTEAAAVGAPGAAPGSDDEARARLGDDFAEVLLLDQATDAARPRDELGWHPTHPRLVDEFRNESYRKVTTA